MSESKASTHDGGRCVDQGDNRCDEVCAAANQKNAADRFGASRQAMASMVRDATIRAVMSAIAHDVSQPLAAVVTNANAGLRWLNRPRPDLDEVQALLARIVKEGHRAGEVVADIRSKFADDHAEPSALSPCEVIADVLALVGDELESHRIAVRNEMPPGLPPLLAERARLQLAFFNLVINAIEAMALVTDRDRVLTITSKICDADQLIISFEDSGAGFDSDDVDRPFEAFVTTKAHRIGMGLPICRKIVEAHGGRVWAEAGRPHGSTFFVKLPIAPASDDGLGK